MNKTNLNIKYLLLYLFVFLVGCSSKPTIAPVTLDETVRFPPTKIGSVSHVTGNVDGSVYSGAYTKIYSGHYDDPKQQAFTDKLRDELLKRGATIESNTAQSLDIEVFFRNTFYESNSGSYSVDIVMKLLDGDKQQEYFYNLNSRDLITFGEFWVMSVPEKRERMEDTLIAYMVSDIKNFVDARGLH